MTTEGLPLPPLPEMGYGREGYSADAMRVYAAQAVKAARAEERERCATFIEQAYERQFQRPWRTDLAAAIRAMED